MKFILTKTSDWNFESTVEINTLEELMKFVEENGRIVLKTNYEIELYDGYRE